MNQSNPITDDFTPKEACTVVVLYEDFLTRQRALAACDYLTRQFWSDIELTFHWWRADFLEDADLAAKAAEAAAAADFLIVALGPDTELSTTLKSWFASWTEQRSGEEGAFVDLTDVGSARIGLTMQREIELRQLARRARMDYLTTMPATLTGPLPASFEAAELRADQLSSVLDEILHHSPPPPHFGLND
jgi:hypothetical protein